MIRKFGEMPYRIVAVHGGPGALGSVAGLARGLADQFGIIEPMQSKSSINDFVDELKTQLENNCTCPVILIGHSWGAWLVGLFAEKYPLLVKKVILIGCGPLVSSYVSDIGRRRQDNMSDTERSEFYNALKCLEDENIKDKDNYIEKLGRICDKADSYSLIELESDKFDSITPDAELFSKTWPEADSMRASGELLERFKNIKCPITLIQGEVDPHPYSGVIEPLKDSGVDFDYYVVKKCGHTPWKEEFASEEFFKVLVNEL